MWPSRANPVLALLAACTVEEPEPRAQVHLPEEVVAPPAPEPGRARLEPLVGTWFGVNLDLDRDSMADFDARLGHEAAAFVQFVDFPMDEHEERAMTSFLEDVAARGGVAVVTFEPRVPLDEITEAMADELAAWLAVFNHELELGVLVRFAHEMNGSWYPWCQQPAAYQRAWRVIAAAIHRDAPRTAMLWAPNYGGGYPFPSGWYGVQADDPDFGLLDTDGDGALTMEDDPYLPYWPGDAYVDWVGLSLYHWGADHPWGENEVAEPGKFVAHVTGTYDGTAGDETAVGDFYATFSVLRDKPMAIVESAALFNTDHAGDELEIKRSWWRQVFADEVFERFPRLRMINWFEWDKSESEIGGARVDWTVTIDPGIRDPFLADFPAERLIFAPVTIEP